MRTLGLLIAFTFVAMCGVAQTLTTLYDFTGGSDGGTPTAPIAFGASGAIYGTTSDGGAFGGGTVFSLTPAAGGGSRTETVLYSFPADSTPHLVSGLVIGAKGALYGTTEYLPLGGFSGVGGGTVFEVAPPTSPGGAWSETFIQTFTGGNGAFPLGGVIFGPGGSLYGTTASGGADNGGVVFALAPPATPGAGWTETILYNFTCGSDGCGSNGNVVFGLVLGANNALYGTAEDGGDYISPEPCNSGCGTVFELTPPAAAGSSWTESTLFDFKGGNGKNPIGGVVVATSGAVYGATYYGGRYGNVYKLHPPAQPGGAWTESVVYAFTGGADGAYPAAGLVLAANGVIYGTTTGGGAFGQGTVFQLTPPATAGAAWTETVLHSFNGSDGSAPSAALTIGRNGALYGTTSGGGTAGGGTVFELTP